VDSSRHTVKEKQEERTLALYHNDMPLCAQKVRVCLAEMRLWTKQLDEDIHDASAAIISFGIAFRHQYLERGELGRAMLDQIPNLFKRGASPRRDRKGAGFNPFRHRCAAHGPTPR
jgi:hypothetical protein